MGIFCRWESGFPGGGRGVGVGVWGLVFCFRWGIGVEVAKIWGGGGFSVGFVEGFEEDGGWGTSEEGGRMKGFYIVVFGGCFEQEGVGEKLGDERGGSREVLVKNGIVLRSIDGVVAE